MEDTREALRSGSAQDQSEVIDRIIDVSCNPGRACRDAIGVDVEGLAGKRVVDIGSGLSDFVALANENGANAFGVDLAYADKTRLKEKGRAFLDEVAGPYAKSKLPKYQKPIIGHDILDRQTQIMEDLNGGSMQRALADIERNPASYVAANCLSLPFPNGTFDLATSNCFLTSTAGAAREFLIESVLEAMRVLKRGSSLRLGVNDFQANNGQWGPEVEANLKAAFEKAKAEKLADKMAKYSIDGRMYWYDIKRSRKR
jgi:SAM-dependent methyltransferase